MLNPQSVFFAWAAATSWRDRLWWDGLRWLRLWQLRLWRVTSWHAKLLPTILLCLGLPQLSFADTQTAADALLVLLPVSAWGATWKQDDPQGRQQLYYDLAATGLSTAILKFAVHESRPADGPNAGDHDSFPSAHTSLTFASAGFIQQRYGWQWGLPAYVLASYTGWSRSKTRHHHERDIYAGALLGIGFSLMLVSPQSETLISVSGRSISLGMRF